MDLTRIEHPEGTRDMFVFHTCGLPEVVAKHQIFTLDELDIHIRRTNDQKHGRDWGYDDVVVQSNPLSSDDENPTIETTSQIAAAVKQEFEKMALELSTEQLNLLAQTYTLSRSLSLFLSLSLSLSL